MLPNTLTRPAYSNLHGFRMIDAFESICCQTGQFHDRGYTKFQNIDIYIFYININIAAYFIDTSILPISMTALIKAEALKPRLQH